MPVRCIYGSYCVAYNYKVWWPKSYFVGTSHVVQTTRTVREQGKVTLPRYHDSLGFDGKSKAAHRSRWLVAPTQTMCVPFEVFFRILSMPCMMYCACRQGADTQEKREVGQTIPTSEIPLLMRAIGFYPTEYQVCTMLVWSTVTPSLTIPQ